MADLPRTWIKTDVCLCVLFMKVCVHGTVVNHLSDLKGVEFIWNDTISAVV